MKSCASAYAIHVRRARQPTRVLPRKPGFETGLASPPPSPPTHLQPKGANESSAIQAKFSWNHTKHIRSICMPLSKGKEPSVNSAPGTRLPHAGKMTGAMAAFGRAADEAVQQQKESVRKQIEEQVAMADRANLVPFSREHMNLRRATGWLLNLAIFGVCWAICFTYGVLAGNVTFTEVMRTWLAAFVLAFFVVEPSEVIVLALIPALEENRCIMKLREKAKEYGFY